MRVTLQFVASMLIGLVFIRASLAPLPTTVSFADPGLISVSEPDPNCAAGGPVLVTGRVTTPGGDPVEDVLIGTSGASPVYTDALGEYRLALPQAAEIAVLYLDATPGPVCVPAGGVEDAQQVDFTVEPSCHRRLSLVDHRGNPIPGAEVQQLGDARDVQSYADAQGSWRGRIACDDQPLVASHPGFLATRVPKGAAVVELVHGVEVRGRVVDHQGAPVANIDVEVTPFDTTSPHQAHASLTDPQGGFVAWLPEATGFTFRAAQAGTETHLVKLFDGWYTFPTLTFAGTTLEDTHPILTVPEIRRVETRCVGRSFDKCPGLIDDTTCWRAAPPWWSLDVHLDSRDVCPLGEEVIVSRLGVMTRLGPHEHVAYLDYRDVTDVHGMIEGSSQCKGLMAWHLNENSGLFTDLRFLLANDKGSFTIEGVPPGTWRLRVLCPDEDSVMDAMMPGSWQLHGTKDILVEPGPGPQDIGVVRRP